MAVNDLFADVYVRNRGFVSIGFDVVSWANRYLSDQRQGPSPKTVGDVLAVGDIVRLRRLDDGALALAQVPDETDNYIEGALISLDPMDGAILALVGGYDFGHSEFNRATQAKRQPGSSFKPFFYMSALAKGYTLASIVNDAPYVENSAALEETRAVENYERIYHGELPLREALFRSLNAAADRVIRDVGAGYAADYVERFGFRPLPVERNASLALGSLGVTLEELAAAYTVLANGGYAVGIRPDSASMPKPYFVQRVEDSQGNVYYDATLSVEMVCPEPEADEDAPEEPERLIESRSELDLRRGDVPEDARHRVSRLLPEDHLRQ